MKLRHLLFLLILVFSCKGSAGLKEPVSDPAFNSTPPPPTEDSIDDAAEVKLRPSPAKLTDKQLEDELDKKPTLKVSPDVSPSSKFSVTTVRMNAPRTTSHSIQLLSPQHNSTYTPGVITFSWKLNTTSKKKHSVVLKVERLDGKKKYSRKVFSEKKLLDLSPGDYKWQVADSRWRLFKVVEMKSHSITDLYNGQTPTGKKPVVKKPLPVISDYIIDLDGPDEAERLPASPPLAPPNWTIHHPTN